MADQDVESARLAFEREKWARESAFREREIALTEHEQKLSGWTNPLTVAVTVAGVAWVGNVVATWWSGRLQRVLEADRSRQQRRLDEIKAESERILEMIKTGDPDKAAANLNFLLDAGLITTKERMKRLKTYLATRKPGSGAVLPVSNDRFQLESAADLPESVAHSLEANLNSFIAYLDNVGFSKTPGHVSVRIVELPSPNAEYDASHSLIRIDGRIVSDPYTAQREYMHHLLFSSKPNYEWTSSIGDLENGVADYFAASFTENPVLGGAKIARVLGVDRDHIRRLDNNLTYLPRKPGEQPHDHGEMWGGAFWEIRGRIGKQTTDRALAAGWQSMPWPVTERVTISTFLKSFFAALETEAGDAGVSEAKTVLHHRKIPVPH